MHIIKDRAVFGTARHAFDLQNHKQEKPGREREIIFFIYDLSNYFYFINVEKGL